MSDISDNQKLVLQKQQENMAKINLLIEQSHEALLCGPSCQKDKTKKSLEEKYNQAKANVQNGPQALEQAKKNYYTFVDGESSYNNILEKELKDKAEKISKLISEKFVEEIDRAKGLNTYLNSDIINSKNTIDLYNDYMKKNKNIETLIKDSRSDLITNDRKTYYEAQEIDSLKFWYNIFYIIFYIFLIIYIVLVVYPSSSLSTLKKIVLIIVLGLYPYYIDLVVVFFIQIFNQLKSYLPKNVYIKTD